MKERPLMLLMAFSFAMFFSVKSSAQCNAPITISGEFNACTSAAGNGVFTYTTESGMTNYQWTFGSGEAFIVRPNSDKTNSLTIRWLSAGTRTLSVIYTDANGCRPSTPKSASINVVNVGSSSASGSTATCVNVASTYTTPAGESSYNWVVNGGEITSGAGTNTIQVVWTTPGRQSLYVWYTSIAGCNSNPVPLYVDVTGSSPGIFGAATTCLNTTSSYTSQPGKTNYNWTVVGGYVSSGHGTNQVSVFWNTAGSQSLSLTYTDPLGCTSTSTSTRVITVNAPVMPSFSGSTTVCNGDYVSFGTDVGMTNYNWSISPSGIGGQFLGSFTTSNPTARFFRNNATLSVYYTDGFGCQSQTLTKTMTVLSKSNPTIDGPGTVCNGSTNSVYTTQAGQSSYNWVVGSGGTITAGIGTNQVTVKWLTNNSSSTISVDHGIGSNGCQSLTTAKSVKITAVPTPSFSQTPPQEKVCLGSIITYSTDGGFSDYVWNVPAEGTVLSGYGTNSIQVQWSIAGSYEISVNYLAGSCRSLTTKRTIPVVGRPTPEIFGPSPVCQGTTNTYSTEAGKSNYVWTIDGVTQVVGETNTIYPAFTTATNKVITVSYKDANGCAPSSPTSRTIVVNSRPAPEIIGDAVGCIHSTNNRYYTDPGKSNYSWSATGGTISSGQGTNDVRVQWFGNTGPATVSVTYKDANGCQGWKTKDVTLSGPSSQTITFNALPPKFLDDAPFTLSATASSGLPVSFTSSASSVATVSGNLVTINGLGSTTITASQPGNGCITSASASQMLYITKRDPVVTFESSSSGEYGTTIYLSVNRGGSTGAVSYSIVSGGSLVTLTGNALSLTGIGTVTIKAQVEADTYYNATFVNQTITITKATQTITFNAIPNLTVGSTLTLVATNTSGLPLTFTSSQPATASITGTSLTANAVGNVTITASHPGNSNYHPASQSRATDIYAVPVATVSGPQNLCSPTITLVGSANNSDCTYLWSTGATTKDIQVTSPGTYSLTVTNGAGFSVTSAPKTVSAAPFAVSISGNSAFCAGGRLELYVNETDPSIFSVVSWAHDPTNHRSIYVYEPGTYTASVTRDGCTVSASFNAVSIQSLNGGTIVPSVADPCLNGNTVILTAGNTGASSYAWSTGQQTSSIAVTTPGNYYVDYVVAGTQYRGCIDVRSCAVARLNNSQQSETYSHNPEREWAAYAQIYPNPAQKLLQIKVPKTRHRELKIQLINTSGIIALDRTVENTNTEISLDIEKVPAGIYVVVVQGGSFSLLRSKVMITD